MSHNGCCKGKEVLSMNYQNGSHQKFYHKLHESYDCLLTVIIQVMFPDAINVHSARDISFPLELKQKLCYESQLQNVKNTLSEE